MTILMPIALLFAFDRLMNYQDRLLYNMQYFHGTKDSARLQLRAMALIWIFISGSRTKFNNPSWSSPFKDINGFQITTTGCTTLIFLNGRRPAKQADHKIH